MKNFILKLTIITALLALVGGLVFSLFIPHHYLPVLPFLLLFFFAVTLLIHAWQLRLAKKDLSKFTRSHILITFFKLILYSVVAIAYMAFKPDNALVFVICLMLLYIVFTLVEVTETSKVIQK